jgi:hypothetical protein
MTPHGHRFLPLPKIQRAKRSVPPKMLGTSAIRPRWRPPVQGTAVGAAQSRPPWPSALSPIGVLMVENSVSLFARTISEQGHRHSES